jgi:hypothetical protein
MQAVLSRMASESAAIPSAESRFDSNAERRRWINHRRADLAGRMPQRRMDATMEIGRHGDLEDIGLLFDLLALPVDADEDPRERELLREAIQRLSGSEVDEKGWLKPWASGLPPINAKRRSLPEDIALFLSKILAAVLLAALIPLCFTLVVMFMQWDVFRDSTLFAFSMAIIIPICAAVVIFEVWTWWRNNAKGGDRDLSG